MSLNVVLMSQAISIMTVLTSEVKLVSSTPMQTTLAQIMISMYRCNTGRSMTCFDFMNDEVQATNHND